MNHYPFDDGALAVLGALSGQKTIKAICGRRVSFDAHAVGKHIDCALCREALTRKIGETRELLALAPSVTGETRAAIDSAIQHYATALGA